MTDALAGLAHEVHALMRQNASVLDDIDQVRRDARQERDALVLDFLDILDGAERGATRLTDSEGRATAAALAAQVRIALESRGMTILTFERGANPPSEQVQVVSTAVDTGLPQLTVVRTISFGLLDQGRIVRRAGVEISNDTGRR